MAKTLQFRRDISNSLNQITGAEGELFVDLDNKSIRVHDANVVGGTALSTVVTTPFVLISDQGTPEWPTFRPTYGAGQVPPIVYFLRNSGGDSNAPGGTVSQAGDLWADTVEGKFYIYLGGAWNTIFEGEG